MIRQPACGPGAGNSTPGAYSCLYPWQDTSKNLTSPKHWVKDKAQCEIAAFYLALPDNVLNIFDTTILEKLTEEETKQPWVYQQCLEGFFVGQDDVQ